MSLILSFCIYLTWLYTVPLEGHILPGWVDPFHIFYFLAAHVPGFWIMAKVRGAWKSRLIGAAFPFMALLTWALLIPQPESRPLFIAMGFAGAPAIAGTLDSLRRASRSLWHVAFALLAANLFAFLIQHLPLALPVKISAVGTLILLPAFMMRGKEGGQGTRTSADRSAMPLQFYGLLFSLFYITGGLMHGYLAPQVAEVEIPANSYTFGYLVMIPLGCMLMQRSYDAVIGLSVLLGVAGFTLLSFQSDATLVLGMVLTQASFGVSDMMVLGLTQMENRRFHETCFIMGTMCFGILAGSLIVMYFGQFLSILVAAANIMMVLTLILYNQLRVRQMKQEAPPGTAGGEETADVFDHPEMECLSDMERQVLRLVMAGATYKLAGETLDIAESTVKTYMQRMFQKFGCTNKRALLNHVKRIKAAWEAGAGEEGGDPPRQVG